MDLHHNIFYAYRGPEAASTDRDRQLENNLTKALINTLRLGGEAVWRPFLAALGCTGATGAKFLLQRGDLPTKDASTRRHRVLLGISRKGSAWAQGGAAGPSYPSIPDAWIYGDGFAVLVESKVGDGDFSDEQMQAHLRRLESGGETPPRVVLKTWGELHTLFGELLPSLAPAPRLLVGQFVEFLEYSDMSEFTGFRPSHFEYFLLHDDEDARRWIREQVEYFAKDVQAALHEIAPFYESYDIGTLRLADSHCWVALGPGDRKYRKATHQSMSLSAAGLRVYVNAELHAATDRLKTLLERSAAEVRAALQRLHEFQPFEIILEERTLRQASLFDYTPKMRLHSSLLSGGAGDVAWHAFAQTVLQMPLPYLRIERNLPPAALVGDRPSAVAQVVQVLERNHEVVALLNG